MTEAPPETAKKGDWTIELADLIAIKGTNTTLPEILGGLDHILKNYSDFINLKLQKQLQEEKNEQIKELGGDYVG